MGKQINYWMDYQSFLLVAQKAIDLGCTILKEDFISGKVLESSDLEIVTADKVSYFFHLPEAGNIEINQVYEKERIKHGYSASGNSIIEAGYSFITNTPERKSISRSRLYCISGYYNEFDEYIDRPDCLTKVYNSLARYIKKIASYTELRDKSISGRDEDYGTEYEYCHKEYITRTCLDMREREGFLLH